MSSIFISIVYVSNINLTEKTINGTASYKIDNEINEYRDIIFKGYLDNRLICNFIKNSILLFIGRYVYEKDEEYVCIYVYTVYITINKNLYPFFAINY